MNNQLKSEEFQFVFDTYTSFDHLKPLIKNISLNSGDLYLTWLENGTDKVDVCIDGWFVGETQKFPTFEALAMHKSSMFAKKWAEQLNKMLNETFENDQLSS
ncbi:hypothetical protein DAMA08_011890 [Martiniozyma asiatica (nom. inval.)]|nr:hypothetical protein DAMA08_011890 [Martiniozyma asiatica]